MPYTEDTLVQQTTADYLRDELGWRAVEDGATVPLYYDARGERLKIATTDLNERIAGRQLHRIRRKQHDLRCLPPHLPCLSRESLSGVWGGGGVNGAFHRGKQSSTIRVIHKRIGYCRVQYT